MKYVTTTPHRLAAYDGGMNQALSPQTPTHNLRPARIHALKAGTWQSLGGAVSLSLFDLAHIAESYNPALHEAPVVIGHPATDDPAFGWVRSAELQPDGLWLNTELLPEMADLVKRSLYKKVSVSLYPPDAPANPVPGGYSIKHLGFLGAQPPAVKGLQGVVLNSESDQTITIEFEEARMGDENKDPAVALAEKQASLAQEQQALTQKKTEIDLAEQNLTKRERDLRQKEWGIQLDSHIQAGRLLPKDKAQVLAFMEGLHGQNVDLGEGEKPMLDSFKEFLAALPAQVNLSEVAPADKAATPPVAVNFAAPAGYEVDAQSLALHQKAKEWMSKNPGKLYTEAIRAIEGGAA